MTKKEKTTSQSETALGQSTVGNAPCEIYIDVLVDQGSAGIGIACSSEGSVQIGAKMHDMTRRSALYIGVLFAMKLPITQKSVKIMSSMGNCAEIVSSTQVTIQKKKHTTVENKFLSSCIAYANTMRLEGYTVQMEQYTTKKSVSIMKSARLYASQAFENTLSTNSPGIPLDCTQLFHNINVVLYCFSGKFRNINIATTKGAEPKTKKKKRAQNKKEKQSSILTNEEKQKEIETKPRYHEIARNTTQIKCMTECFFSNGVFALCSRCSSCICVSCSNPKPFVQSILSESNTRYTMVLTTCKHCVCAMIESSPLKPSIQAVTGYLQECFDNIHLSDSYMSGSSAFNTVQKLGMVPCALYSKNGIAKYVDVFSLSDEFGFGCYSCDVDLKTQTLAPHLTLGFL